MGGGDKTLMDLAGQPMLLAILERLEPQVPHIVLNANGDPERFSQYKLPVVADPVGEFAGPLAGILAGLEYARSRYPEATHVVSVAGDTPFFPRKLVKKLTKAVPENEPVIALAASSSKLHPVFGLWPVALRDDLHAWLTGGNSGKVLAFVDRHKNVEVAFDLDPETGLDPFFNANRPDDLEQARNALKGQKK